MAETQTTKHIKKLAFGKNGEEMDIHASWAEQARTAHVASALLDTTTGVVYPPQKLVGKKIEDGGEIFNGYESYTYTDTSGTITIGANTASGKFSHAEGIGTQSTKEGSHAEGRETEASGNYAHAEGRKAVASGFASHAEGRDTTASSNSSHAEGYKTKATGDNAHAEGTTATASGNSSHAEGITTTASGNASHTEGYGTTASRKSQHVQGEYNIEDTGGTDKSYRGKYAHIVGNGTSDTDRSNAHTLDWEGNAWYAGNVYASNAWCTGDVYVGGNNQNDGAVRLPRIYSGNTMPTDLSEYKTGDIFILVSSSTTT